MTTAASQSTEIHRPVARIRRFLFREDALKIAEGEPDWHLRNEIEFYGLDGMCIIRIEGFPACQRTTDEEWNKDAAGNWPEQATIAPHVHKDWCHNHEITIPFVRGGFRKVVGIYRDADGKESGRHERNAWGWDGEREKPSLTPSFLMESVHTAKDPAAEHERFPHVFHCFVGDPYGPGTGRFGPGELDLLESHIKTPDGRSVPIIRGG